ncbi:MAG: DUF4129 domain-containing protein [Isosphaeraceae bacterium]
MVTILLAAAMLGPAWADGDEAIPRAMAKGGYPWYDAPRDAAKPITPPPPPRMPTVRTGWSAFNFSWVDIGQLFIFLVMAGALIALIAYLAKTWQRYLEGLEPNVRPGKAPASASGRSAALPAGLRVETDDPWAEAKARRDRGDLSGAIVCLFVYLLITLDQRGLIRLTPGRTGRQLVRSIGADEIRGLADPTLRLFEAAYYGRRAPDPAAFAQAWGRAEDLRGRLSTEAQR